jgi:hypothetical protein
VEAKQLSVVTISKSALDAIDVFPQCWQVRQVVIGWVRRAVKLKIVVQAEPIGAQRRAQALQGCVVGIREAPAPKTVNELVEERESRPVGYGANCIENAVALALADGFYSGHCERRLDLSVGRTVAAVRER